MAIRTVGPGKTYASFLTAFPAAGSGDIIECYFNTTDTNFVLLGVPGITVRAMPGFTPSWKTTSGTLCTINTTGLTIEGLTLGVSDNSSPAFFTLAPGSGSLVGALTLTDCKFSFGSGAPSILGAVGGATGDTVLTLTMTRCTMSESTNNLTTIMAVSGASVTKLGRGVLNIADSTLKTTSIRTVSANGLFNAQTVTKSILKIVTNSGASTDFNTASTQTFEQSILDGLTTAAGLLSCNQTNTTLSVKNTYIMRGAGTAIAITNPSGKPFNNCVITGNVTAGINSTQCVTQNCLFGSNGSNYAGGGAVDTTDKIGQTPTYTSLATGDYTPTGSSDTRDKGVDLGFVTDIRGEVIPQGGAFDAGPYEYPARYVPALQSVDNALRLTTNLAGVPHPDSVYEIVPADGTGTLTDIKHLLMMWAGTDKYVPTQELPADVRDAEWPDNRGWMADKTAGNRMWLFDRRPLSTQVDTEMQLMLTEDLLWLTTDGIAASYTVAVTHTGRRRNVEIEVKRLDGQLEKYGVADLWENRVVT